MVSRSFVLSTCDLGYASSRSVSVLFFYCRNGDGVLICFFDRGFVVIVVVITYVMHTIYVFCITYIVTAVEDLNISFDQHIVDDGDYQRKKEVFHCGMDVYSNTITI